MGQSIPKQINEIGDVVTLYIQGLLPPTHAMVAWPFMLEYWHEKRECVYMHTDRSSEVPAYSKLRYRHHTKRD